MATRPNPARVASYEAKLAELIAARDTHRAERNDQRVRVLNRQILAQRKWIRWARELEGAERRA